MAATPYISTYNVTTVEAPGASLGQSVTDTITFYQGGLQLANTMVANQYYTIASVGGVNFGSYGTLQTNQGIGVANTVGAVYLASGPATLITGPTGMQMSFANNSAGIGVATITTAATGGTAFAVGQVVTGTGLPAAGVQILSQISGTLGATSSTYLCNGATGTIGAEAVTVANPAYVIPSPLAQNSVILTNPALLVPSTVLSGVTASSPYGFDTAADAKALINQVQAIANALLSLGIMCA